MATTATTSAPSTRARAFPLMYFVIAFAFTWLFWGLAALGARDVVPALPGLTVIGTFGPLVAAVILTAQESGGVGVRSLLGRILQWRVAPIWYAVALLGPLVITLVAMVLEVVLLGVPPPSLGLLLGELPSTLLTLVVNALYFLIFVTLGEEVGWRGYALPALQARYSALLASLILGVVWASWHLPVFFNPDTSYNNVPFFLFLAVFEALTFGLGISFLLFGFVPLKRALGGSSWRTWAAYLAIGWFLVSWWPHDNMHIHNGSDLQGLLYIEYGFHLTLMVAGLLLAYSLLTLLRAGEDAGVRSGSAVTARVV